jgi:hypothetical protein
MCRDNIHIDDDLSLRSAAIIYMHSNPNMGEVDMGGIIRDLVRINDPNLGAHVFLLIHVCYLCNRERCDHYASRIPAVITNAEFCMQFKKMILWGWQKSDKSSRSVALDVTKIGLDFRVIIDYLLKTEEYIESKDKKYWGYNTITGAVNYLQSLVNDLILPQNSPGYPILLRYIDSKTGKIDIKGLANYLVDRNEPRLAAEILVLLKKMSGQIIELRAGNTWRGDKFGDIKVSLDQNPLSVIGYIENINFLREIYKEFERLEKYRGGYSLGVWNWDTRDLKLNVEDRIKFLQYEENIVNLKEWQIIKEYISQNGKMDYRGLSEKIVRSDENSAIKLLLTLSKIDDLRLITAVNEWKDVTIKNVVIRDELRWKYVLSHPESNMYAACNFYNRVPTPEQETLYVVRALSEIKDIEFLENLKKKLEVMRRSPPYDGKVPDLIRHISKRINEIRTSNDTYR